MAIGSITKKYGNTTYYFLTQKVDKEILIYQQIEKSESDRIKNNTYQDTVDGEVQSIEGSTYTSDLNEKNYAFVGFYDASGNYQSTGLSLAEPQYNTVSNSLKNDSDLKKLVVGSQNTTSVDPNQPGTPGGSSTPVSEPNQPAPNPSDVLKYPLNMRGDQDRIKFTVMRVAKSTAVNPSDAILATRPTFTPVSGVEPIFLPIQSGISDQNSVNWGPGEINELQRLLVNASTRAQRSGNNLGNVALDEARDMIDLFRSTIDSGLANIYFAEQAVGVQNLLSRVTGSIINPNLELLFQGPQLRPFNFTFKLSPRSLDEAKVVKKIIKSFKKNMSPIFEDGGLFLKAPNVFKIEYQYGTSSPHPGLNLIKECALTNCSVDYTPNGTYMTYPEGTMVSYTLNLQFQEIEPVYSKDYDEDPGKSSLIGY